MIMNFQKLGEEKGRPLLDALGTAPVCCVRLVPNGEEMVMVAPKTRKDSEAWVSLREPLLLLFQGNPIVVDNVAEEIHSRVEGFASGSPNIPDALRSHDGIDRDERSPLVVSCRRIPESDKFISCRRPETPPSHKYLHAPDGCARHGTEEVVLRAISLLTQQLATQERLEHP